MDDLEGFNIRGQEKWGSKANDVVTISLVKKPDNLKEGEFHPEFTHQIFGDNELIFGYSDLSVKLHFTAGSLRSFLRITFSEKYQGAEFPVTEIERKLAEWIPEGYTMKVDEFRQWVEADAEKFRPIGETVHEYTLGDPATKYIVTRGTLETPGLKAFHERFQTFAIFEIDAARFLDDDPRWEFFYLFEQKTEGGVTRYSTVGYVTWYRFFHYPSLIRPRISQFLILPPYRGLKHGKTLYETVFRDLSSRKDVVDVAVEDPAEGFQCLRTISDLQYLTKGKFLGHPALEILLDKEKLAALQKKTKLSPKQTINCLEILAFKALKGNKANQKKYRLLLKKRFFREDEGLGAVEKAERYEKLDGMYKVQVDSYAKILESL